MTHPAARMTKTPAMKTIRILGWGFPAPAIHKAHNAGHSSSHVPMGRSSRASSAYSSIRRTTRCRKGASRYGASSSLSSGATAAIQLPHASITFSRPDPAGRESGNIIRVSAKQQLRRLLNTRQEVSIAHEVRDPHLREPCLPGAEQLARAAQFEIPPRNLEAVVRLTDHLQSLAGQLRQRCTVQQHAGARFSATAHPAAELMQ